MGIVINTKEQSLVNVPASHSRMSVLAVISLLLFPVSTTVLDIVSGAIIVFIFLSSIMLYLFPLKGERAANHDERMFYFAISFMALVVALVSIVSGVDYLGLKKLGKFLYILMVLPVYFFFRTIRVSVAWLWYGVAIGAIVSALVGIYEVTYEVFKPGYPGRAKGATHPIIFGDLALMLGVMALAGWGWFKSRSPWMVAIPLVACLAGVLASILSQSRGGWVAIPFLVIVFVWFYSSQISRVKMAVGVFAICSVFAVSYFVPQTGLKKKVHVTVTNISNYINAENKSKAGQTSVTSRFEMWKAAWDIFLENPILGVGWGNYRENVSEMVRQGERSKQAGSFDHPHNQFLSAMVSGGILALFAVVCLFVIPAKIFFNVCKSPAHTIEAQRFALAGLLLMVGFAIFNLSESFLERSRTVSFFIFYLAVFMAGIQQRQSGATKVAAD